MILGISGSPKQKSNTTSVLQNLLSNCKSKGLESKLIELANFNILPCKDCGICKNKLDCPEKDNFLQIIPFLKKAKIIVIGSPVYFGTVTAQLKAFMDRSVMLRRNGFALASKFGCGIAIGGSRNGGQELTLQTIHNWMLIHDMHIFADGQPTSHFGGALVGRKSGDAVNDQIGMQTVESLTNKIIQLTK
ncbi:flavodoxin family protein [Candidatus Margulisiibacteriota bacterium]